MRDWSARCSMRWRRANRRTRWPRTGSAWPPASTCCSTASKPSNALEQTILQLAVRGLLVPQDPADEPASRLLERIHAEKNRLIAAGKIKRYKPLPNIVGNESPTDLPVGWIEVTIPDLCKVGGGATRSRTKTAHWEARYRG